jgi:hypothetical protein
MQVMIALVGEQPLPNFLPVRFYKPASVLFVYTGRTKRVYERLHTTLSREAQIYGLEVEPFDIVAVTRKIQARLEELALDDTMLLFNVTGGTKAMALAAYQIAQQRAASILYLESEGKQSCAYTYTWAGQTPQHHSRGSIPPCVTLNDLLDIYCGPKQWFIAGPNRLEGGPFEIAIADALREHVDELYIGVKAFGGQVDLDIAIRVGNQFGIIEAKAGSGGGKLDGIKQLNTAGQQLGTYVKRFFVITVPASPGQNEIINLSRVRVISLREYKLLQPTLSTKDADVLVAAIQAELKE